MTEPVRSEEERDERDPDRRRAWRTVAAGVFVIIIVLIFLILWDPFDQGRTTKVEGRHPGIVGALEGLPASDDYIGLWLKPGKDIEAVLHRHGLSEDGIVFAQKQDGYYVISAGERDIEAVVEELKGDSALYDAGRVYEEAPPVTP